MGASAQLNVRMDPLLKAAGDAAKKAGEASRKAWFHRNIANEAKKMRKKQAHVKGTPVPVE